MEKFSSKAVTNVCLHRILHTIQMINIQNFRPSPSSFYYLVCYIKARFMTITDVLHPQTFLTNAGDNTQVNAQVHTYTHRFCPHSLYVMFLFAMPCAVKER